MFSFKNVKSEQSQVSFFFVARTPTVFWGSSIPHVGFASRCLILISQSIKTGNVFDYFQQMRLHCVCFCSRFSSAQFRSIGACSSGVLYLSLSHSAGRFPSSIYHLQCCNLIHWIIHIIGNFEPRMIFSQRSSGCFCPSTRPRRSVH